MATAAQAEVPCRLLIFGDSLAAEWGAPPPSGWQQIVVGRPGARASDLAADLPAALARTRPQALLLLAGSNDARDAALWPWSGQEQRAAAALAGMARAGQAQGARVLVADLVPPGAQPWWRALLIGERQGRAMAAIMARLALPPGTRRLQASQLLAGPGGGVDPALRRDHLHLNGAGYARLAARLPPLLQGTC